jgi:hypothetical protein
VAGNCSDTRHDDMNPTRNRVVAVFHCLARIVPVKRGSFAGTLADFPDELGEGIQSRLGRTLHGRREVEERALLDDARKINP